MLKRNLALATLITILTAGAAFATDKAPTTEQQIAGLQSMCSTGASAQTARQAETALYTRLGGYDKILTLTRDIVRRHKVNPPIKHMFDHVDSEALARHVADFVAAGTGGYAHYQGRSMTASHAHLKLTDADFLAAGGDIIAAMKSLGHGQNEIDEVLCILVSLKDQVVLK